MTAKAAMPVRFMNLVEPLGASSTSTPVLTANPTARRTTDTTARHISAARSGAVTPLIGASLRQGDVDSSTLRSTRATTPGARTSSTATATPTTRTTSSALAPSADSRAFAQLDRLALQALGKDVHAYILRHHPRRTHCGTQLFLSHSEVRSPVFQLPRLVHIHTQSVRGTALAQVICHMCTSTIKSFEGLQIEARSLVSISGNTNPGRELGQPDRDTRKIAVLFARADSHYKTIPSCDVWDEARDARKWPGGTPLIAHPPCRAWGRLRQFAKPRPDEKQLGIDAVAHVRRYGGVLEHPEESTLFPYCRMPEPGEFPDEWGGWTLRIEQFHWGHRAQKATWLYIVGCQPSDLPPMPRRPGRATHCVRPTKNYPRLPSITKAEREHTPPPTGRLAGGIGQPLQGAGADHMTTLTLDTLLQAYIDCRQHKRNTTSAREFEQHVERNLCDLHAELLDGSYRPGRSICFAITRPKPREVWAAQFRDRIVHHLLYNHIGPRFEASFVADSCACIPGRGTLYGAQRLEAQVRSCTQNWARPAFYLKCDCANFFVSIHKPTLLQRLAARIRHEPWWLALATTILMHDPRSDVEVRGKASTLRRVPAHKSLFNAPADTGLPIGNLSSQFFANVLLDGLDQYAKHQLRAPHYVRYVDDFILLHPDAQWLSAALRDITAWLPTHLGVRLNPSKTILQPVDRGIDFVGQVIKPWRRTTRRRTLASALQRIEHLPAAEVFSAGNSYLGLVRQARHSHMERAAVCRALLKRGHAVEGMHLSKAFRRSEP